MTRAMTIDPRGSHGLRNAMRNASITKARIKQTEDGVCIEFSDGRSVSMIKEPRVSTNSFMAAAVQWARRHGANSIEIELWD